MHLYEIMLVFAAVAKEEQIALTGVTGFITALVAGGVGGGGAVALILTFMYLRHLREEHAELMTILQAVSARNAALTDKLVGLISHPEQHGGS
jgi:uncharacterized membrane protein YfcA